ncbi:MAG: hypothetical protein B7Y43_01375 [Sphingomonas sp. 28-62-20]|uniref:hypothetical protein n=1 Tax=Sphingomonas sp. 28-62-20 TaxID=1970433 RepID=UPI000AE492B5|nr:MAG: hypothetical protein B7Y43_01375 [Sphingomonas sp. 28-62-20]
MNYGSLVYLFALLIPIVAIVAKQIVQPWLRLREKQIETEASMIAEKAAQYAAQTERLEQRVRVLERITTDRGIDIADEIEKLRDPKPLN